MLIESCLAPPTHATRAWALQHLCPSRDSVQGSRQTVWEQNTCQAGKAPGSPAGTSLCPADFGACGLTVVHAGACGERRAESDFGKRAKTHDGTWRDDCNPHPVFVSNAAQVCPRQGDQHTVAVTIHAARWCSREQMTPKRPLEGDIGEAFLWRLPYRLFMT